MANGKLDGGEYKFNPNRKKKAAPITNMWRGLALVPAPKPIVFPTCSTKEGPCSTQEALRKGQLQRFSAMCLDVLCQCLVFDGNLRPSTSSLLAMKWTCKPTDRKSQ